MTFRVPRSWEPADYEDTDIYALRALQHGAANADQQKRALNLIVNQIAATYDKSFRPDDFGGIRESDFAEGRRHVGLEIIRILNTIRLKGETDGGTEQQPAKHEPDTTPAAPGSPSGRRSVRRRTTTPTS